jgi:hypothetical protein
MRPGAIANELFGFPDTRQFLITKLIFKHPSFRCWLDCGFLACGSILRALFPIQQIQSTEDAHGKHLRGQLTEYW